MSSHNLSSHNLSTHPPAWQAWRLATSTCALRGRRVHTQLVITQLVLTQLVLTQLVNTQLVLTQLAHTQLPHTQRAHTQLVLTQLVNTSTCALRFRHGTYGTGRALVAQRVPVVAVASRVAGVALGNIHLRFAWHFANVAISWQEWQPVVLFCSARYRLHRADAVPLTCPFCSYVWCFSPHLCVGFLCGRGGRHGCWCGRRGPLRHPPLFHVAGVVLGDVHTYVCITFPAQLFLLLDPCHHLLCLSFLPSPSQLLHAHTHTRTHTHTCTHTHTPHTQLITTQLTHTYSSTHNLLHTNPSPSLFSFLLSPCHLYLSFAACWKKLTCGVVRSFNLRIWAFSRRNGPTKVGVSGTLRMLAPDVPWVVGSPPLQIHVGIASPMVDNLAM